MNTVVVVACGVVNCADRHGGFNFCGILSVNIDMKASEHIFLGVLFRIL